MRTVDAETKPVKDPDVDVDGSLEPSSCCPTAKCCFGDDVESAGTGRSEQSDTWLVLYCFIQLEDVKQAKATHLMTPIVLRVYSSSRIMIA